MIEESPVIAFKIENGLAIASMSRPKNRNAFTLDLLTAVQCLWGTCEINEVIRSVFLTGIVVVFSAVGDIQGMIKRIKSGEQHPDYIRKRIYKLNE